MTTTPIRFPAHALPKGERTLVLLCSELSALDSPRLFSVPLGFPGRACLLAHYHPAQRRPIHPCHP